VATTAIALLAGGCVQTQSWMDGIRGGESRSNDPVILGAPDADHYLNELYDLAAGDPATQAEIFADAESESTLTPGPQSNLRFALVLATPGHPESDPAQAQSLLREILARPELLTPAEISLATIHLKSAERLMVLEAETQRQRASSTLAARTEQQAVNERLATVEAENRQLRRELSEAEEKLEAITSIEQSIRAQDP
jgi:hypothetical protein